MTEIVWGWITAVDLFLIGTAGGAAIIASLALIFGKEKYVSLVETGSYIAPIFGILSIVTVIIDLGRFTDAPGNMLYTFSNYPNSMISLGTVLRILFIVIGLANAFLWIFRMDNVGNYWGRIVLGVIHGILGLSVTLYPGIMLSLARGIQLWNSPAFPWVLSVSSVLTGLALSALMGPVIGSVMPGLSSNLYESRSLIYGELTERLSLYLGITTLVEMVILVIYMASVTSAVGFQALMTSASFWVGFVFLGLVLPLVIYALGWLKVGLSESIRSIAIVTSFLLVIIGSLLGRYVLLLAAQL